MYDIVMTNNTQGLVDNSNNSMSANLYHIGALSHSMKIKPNEISYNPNPNSIPPSKGKAIDTSVHTLKLCCTKTKLLAKASDYIFHLVTYISFLSLRSFLLFKFSSCQSSNIN